MISCRVCCPMGRDGGLYASPASDVMIGPAGLGTGAGVEEALSRFGRRGGVMGGPRFAVTLVLVWLTVLLAPAQAAPSGAGNGLPPSDVGTTLTRLPTARRLVALTFDAGSGNE